MWGCIGDLAVDVLGKQIYYKLQYNIYSFVIALLMKHSSHSSQLSFNSKLTKMILTQGPLAALSRVLCRISQSWSNRIVRIG